MENNSITLTAGLKLLRVEWELSYIIFWKKLDEVEFGYWKNGAMKGASVVMSKSSIDELRIDWSGGE